MPLELFFDLVFVLAITQCTALMAHEPDWTGLGKGLLILGVLWWTWIGYAWLTSVVDPEEGIVRLLIISAMAALLVVSLCVPHVFDDHALLFACAITVARTLHIGLFILGSRDDPGLRSSVLGLAGSTTLGCGLLIVGSFLGSWQGWVWLLALVLDMSRPEVLRPGRLEARAGPLRRALRADRADRARRVDRRDRRGQRRPRRHRHRDRRGPRRDRVGRPLLAVLRRRLAGGRAAALQRDAGARAERHRARLVHLPPPPDGGRHRARRARLQEDPRPRARAPAARAGDGAARRHGALPARARRLPLAQRAPPDVRAARRRRPLRRADRAGGADPGDRDPRGARRRCSSR